MTLRLGVTLLGCFIAVGCSDRSSDGSPDGGAPQPDAMTDAAVADAAPPAPGSEYVFDDEQLRTYELTVEDADWQWLNDNALRKEYVPAKLTFEGEVYEQIGVRYKGQLGTLLSCFDEAGDRICDKLSIKLKFNKYDDEGRFYGLKRLNFNSMKNDASAMHNRLGYSLFHDMGVVAPRAVHARLIVNGELLGLFELVEQIDGRFTRDRFEDGKGNVYKTAWPQYQFADYYLDTLKTNEDEDPDVSKMLRFAAAIAGAADETAPVLLESLDGSRRDRCAHCGRPSDRQLGWHVRLVLPRERRVFQREPLPVRGGQPEIEWSSSPRIWTTVSGPPIR